MSKQFSILTTDVDLLALEKILQSSGDVELLSDVPTRDDRGLQPLASLAIPLAQAGKVPLFCYLAPKELPQSTLIKRVSPVKVHVDLGRSYLIEFWRPFYDGRVMRRGRLYYDNWLFEAGNFLPKNPDFCRWADRVMARAKRTLRYDKSKGAHAGTHAAEQIASGALEVLTN